MYGPEPILSPPLPPLSPLSISPSANASPTFNLGSGDNIPSGENFPPGKNLFARRQLQLNSKATAGGSAGVGFTLRAPSWAGGAGKSGGEERIFVSVVSYLNPKPQTLKPES